MVSSPIVRDRATSRTTIARLHFGSPVARPPKSQSPNSPTVFGRDIYASIQFSVCSPRACKNICIVVMICVTITLLSHKETTSKSQHRAGKRPTHIDPPAPQSKRTRTNIYKFKNRD